MTRFRNVLPLICSTKFLGRLAVESMVQTIFSMVQIIFWAFAAAKKAEFAANWLLASELGSKSTPWPNPEQSLPIPAFRLPNCCWLSRNMLIPVYVGADGKQTAEVQCLYSAMKPLREIYEATARNLRSHCEKSTV